MKMVSLLHSTIIALLTSAVAGHGGVWNYSIAGDWRPGYTHLTLTKPAISINHPN
jgi:hypothetical protein